MTDEELSWIGVKAASKSKGFEYLFQQIPSTTSDGVVGGALQQLQSLVQV